MEVTQNGTERIGNIKNSQIPLIRMLDLIATSRPQKTYCYIAKTEDIDDGFKPVTYNELLRAVNSMARWLIDALGPISTGKPQTVGYIGPDDLRYPIWNLACIKAGRTALYPSTYNSPAGQISIVQSTGCMILMAPATHKHLWDAALEGVEGTRYVEMPALEVFLAPDELKAKEVEPDGQAEFGYSTSWDEVKDTVMHILQSSGTTGTPKALPYTNEMYLHAEILDERTREDGATTMTKLFYGQRMLLNLPMSWMASNGMMLYFSLYTDLECIIPPISAGPPFPPETLSKIMDMTDATIGLFTPDMIRQMTASASSLSSLTRLKAIVYVGAGLDKETGDILSQSTRVQSMYGATDAGLVPLMLSDRTDWQWTPLYTNFAGWALEHFSSDLHELVQRRRPDVDVAEQVYFGMYPNETVFHTKDLFREHPTKKGYWQMVGRTDDFVKLASMTKFNAVDIEAVIDRYKFVKGSLVAGDARRRTFVIVEPVEEIRDLSRDEVLDKTWPAIEEANKIITEEARLSRDLVLIASPDKPFQRTLKGTLSRRAVLAMYEAEIDELYKRNEA